MSCFKPENFNFCLMSEFEENEALNDFADFDVEPPEHPNKRTSIRYIRSDIRATVRNTGLLKFGAEIPVDLIDVGSKGALIATEKKIGVNQKIMLSLLFNSGRTYTIKAKVVHVVKASKSFRYGLKFDHYNNELGDHLFETQDKLLFK